MAILIKKVPAQTAVYQVEFTEDELVLVRDVVGATVHGDAGQALHDALAKMLVGVKLRYRLEPNWVRIVGGTPCA